MTGQRVDSGETFDSGRRRSFREGGASAVDELIFRIRSRRILREFPTRADVVADLGSGYDFRLLRHLQRVGRIRRGIAVDVSLDQSRVFGEPRFRLLETDLNRRLDVPAASVDVALSLAVIEHLTHAEVHLTEAYRILRPEGILLLTSPSKSSRPLLEFLAYRLHLIDADEIRDHKHYFGGAEIRKLLVAAGFADAEISYRTFLLGLNQFVVARKR